jgi:hypothetical protein
LRRSGSISENKFRQCDAAGRENQTGVIVEKVAIATAERSMGVVVTGRFLAVLGKPLGYHPPEIAAGHSHLIQPAGSQGKIPHVRTRVLGADGGSPKKSESRAQTQSEGMLIQQPNQPRLFQWLT